MRVVIVVPTLTSGGAERLAVMIARHLRIRHRTTVVTYRADADHFDLDPGVLRIDLRAPRIGYRALLARLSASLLLLRRLRTSIIREAPDVILSFMNRTNVRVLVSTVGLGIPVVVTEHNYPPLNPIGIGWSLLRRLTYGWASSLVSVSRGVDACFDWLPRQRRAVIYNPIELDVPAATGPKASGRGTVVSVGRLAAVKRFDLLIRAFRSVAGLCPGWRLVIYGEGSERARLERLVAEMGLSDRVALPGATAQVGQALVSADIFCLTSRTEGLGHALLEAMYCGLAVVATDCPVGPRELVRDRENGLLVENGSVDAVARGIETLIKDPDLRTTIGRNAREFARQYALEPTMQTWETILGRAAAGARRRPEPREDVWQKPR